MAKYLDNTGLAHLIDKIKDGTLKAGRARTADVALAVDAANITGGIIDWSHLPKGAIEQMVVVSSLDARLHLTNEQIQNGDTVHVQDTTSTPNVDKMYYVVDDTKLAKDGLLASEEAFHEYAVGTADRVKNDLSFYVGADPVEAGVTLSPDDYVIYNGSESRKMTITPNTIHAATEEQGGKADTAIQGVKVNGTLLTPDLLKEVDVSVPAPITTATDIYLTPAYVATGTHPKANDSVQKAIAALHNTKVDKVTDKGLSTNDFDNTYKAIVDNAVEKDDYATTAAAGIVKLGDERIITETPETGTTGTEGRVYPVQENSNHQLLVNVPWTNTTYAPASLGFGRGTCAAFTKVNSKDVGAVILPDYALTIGGIVAINFSVNVPASSSLNIANKGAKPIFYRGVAIGANIIAAHDTATFIYDGTNYHLLCVDRPAITNSEIDILITPPANNAG